MQRKICAWILSLCMAAAPVLGAGTPLSSAQAASDEIAVEAEEMVSAEFAGEGTESSPYQINTIEDLEEMASQIASGNTYAGKYFVLEENLDYAQNEFMTIGKSGSKAFAGTFDGNGKTIANVTITSSGMYAGVFAVNNGTIKNLTFSNLSLTGTGTYTGLVAYNKGQITGVTVTDSAISGADCTGGIAGYQAGSLHKTTVENSSVTGGDRSGGLAGALTGTVRYCANVGTYVEGTLYTGGVVGDAIANSNSDITGCSNTGHIHNSSGMSGGIAGRLNTNTKIRNSWNAGQITGGAAQDAATTGLNLGGIAGSCLGYIYNCLNSGAVICYGGANICAGGICGSLEADASYLGNLANYGNVTGEVNDAEISSYLGGIFGRSLFTDDVANCYTTGKVSGSLNVAGSIYTGCFAGRMSGTVTNAFCIEATQPSVSYSDSSAAVSMLSEAELKSDDFLESLNARTQEDSNFEKWLRNDNLFGGYPYISIFNETSLLGIRVVSAPDKTEYQIGEELDTTGLRIQYYYSDGSVEETDEYEVGDFNNMQIGVQDVSVTARGYSVTFPVRVSLAEEVSVASIEIARLPYVTTYYYGTSFDSTGLKVLAALSDETQIDVTEDCTFEGFDSTKEGECEVTVVYREYKTVFTVTIRNEFDAYIRAHFAFEEEIADDSGNDVGLYSSSSYNLGALTYVDGISGKAVGMANEVSSSVKYNVIRLQNNIIPSGSTRYSISIWVYPESLSWYRSVFYTARTYQWLNMAPGGDRTDKANGTYHTAVWLYNEDGYDNDAVSYDLNGAEELPLNEWSMLTYTYGGGTACLYINGQLVDTASDVVNALGGSSQATYLLGNTNGDASFDGYIDELYMYDIDLSPENVWELYREQVPDAENIDYLEIASLPVKTEYEVGESLNTQGLAVNAYYMGTDEAAALTDYTLSGYDMSVEGKQVVLIEKDGAVTGFEITVGNGETEEPWQDASVESVFVLQKPDQMTYCVGEAFDRTGMQVAVTYSNGVTVLTEDYEIKDYTSVLAGRQLVRALSGGVLSDGFYVEVENVQNQLSGMRIDSLPDKLDYYVGETFVKDGLTASALYLGGSAHKILNRYLSCQGFDSNTEGTCTVTVAYGAFEESFEVQIHEPEMTGLRIVKKPANTTYYKNEELDLTGLKLVAEYETGEAKQISDYTVQGETTAIGSSEVTLTAGGKSVSYEIQVLPSVILLNKTAATIYTSGTTTVTLKAVKIEDSDASVKWTSSNPAIAAVKDGVVTAKGTGTAIITASTKNASAICVVTVKAGSLTDN